MDYPKSVPSVGLVNGRFVDEDPGAGTPGSLIPSAWGNAVTDEILAVISDAGLTPDEENHGQLKEALNRRDASATATQAEAEEGVENTKRMTPLRVFQAIAEVVKQATESAFGWAKVATQVQVDEGVDDTTFVTPKKIRRGISYSLEPNGYFAFPSLMGGWIVQWGRGISAVSGPVTVPFQIAFPSKKFFEIAIPIVGSPIGWDVATSTGDASLAQAIFNRRAGNGSSTNASSNFDIYWMSIGK